MKKNKLLLLGMVVFMYALIVIPLVLLNQESRQDIRSRADNSTAPQVSLLGPTSGSVGSSLTYNAAVSGTRLTGTEIYVSPKNSQQWTKIGGSNTSCNFTASCSASATWTPNSGGEYYVAINSYSDSNGNNTPNQPSEQCSGNPFDLPTGWVDCGASDVLTVTITSSTTTPLPTVCSTNTPVDVSLVIDRSGSMNDKTGTGGITKIASAKTAAVNFVNILSQNPQNRLGLSTFASNGSLDNTLTNSYATINSKINAIVAKDGTCIECGIKRANADIQAAGRDDVKKVVVLLTDGLANFVDGNSQQQTTSLSEQRALAAATAGHTADGTIFFTIGLGKDVNANFLQQLATSTGGKYYFSPTTDQLNGIYTEISQLVAKGSVAGTVFKDTNKNALLDTNEQKLSGWTVQISLATASQSGKTTVTDTNGAFSLTGLCDGAYTVKPILQSGWKQTFPTNAQPHTITIANASVITDKNFGVAEAARCSDAIDNDTNGFTDAADSSCHTDGNLENSSTYDPERDGEHGGNNTCGDSKDNNGNGLIDGADPVCHTDGDPDNPDSYDPDLPEGASSLKVNLILHGIGAGGDNANPQESSLSNKNPLHKTRSAEVVVYGGADEIIASGSSNVTYNTASGQFSGTVPLNRAVAPGKYSVKLSTDRYLKRYIPDIQTLTGELNQQLPALDLVAGDIDNNNKINILDYNLLLDCYSDLTSASASCSTQKKTSADINDDSNVNQADYNLFLREILTQPGS